MREIGGVRGPMEAHSIEAEQQLLGAMLLDNAIYDRVSDRITEASFYEPLHGRIYRMIGQRLAEGTLASPVILARMLADDPALQALGGPGYLARLASASISSRAAPDYAQMIADDESRRMLQKAVQEAFDVLGSAERSPASVASELEEKVGKVLSRGARRKLIGSHLSTVAAAVTFVTNVITGEGSAGVGTGLPQLDEALGKMRPGELILLGGRPGAGKTSIAQNIAFNAAQSGVGVFFASLEMLQADMGVRFLARGLADRGMHVPHSRMLRGALSEDEHRAVAEEAQRQADLPILMAQREVRAIPMLRSAVRRAVNVLADTPTPLGLVVVDYLQLLHAAEGKGGTYDRVSAASDACKDLAMELSLPVLALAQLSRSVESRDPAIPQLQDLRDSGRLEEDADAIIFAYREAYYLKRKIEACADDGERMALRDRLSRVEQDLQLIVAKQRQGPGGTVQARMDLACCQMTADYADTDTHLI